MGLVAAVLGLPKPKPRLREDWRGRVYGLTPVTTLEEFRNRARELPHLSPPSVRPGDRVTADDCRRIWKECEDLEWFRLSRAGGYERVIPYFFQYKGERKFIGWGPPCVS